MREDLVKLVDKYGIVGADDGTVITAVENFLANYDSKAGGICSFPCQIWAAQKWGLVKPTNDVVIVDEAQDTSRSKAMLYLAALKPGGTLVIVGDPLQSIYGFTGAMNDALEQFKALASERGVKVVYVEAVAGAGKTTTIEALIVSLHKAAQKAGKSIKVLYACFNNHNAEEAMQKIPASLATVKNAHKIGWHAIIGSDRKVKLNDKAWQDWSALYWPIDKEHDSGKVIKEKWARKRAFRKLLALAQDHGLGL